MLDREGPEEEVLADAAQLEEVRAEPPAQLDLLVESAVPHLGRDRLPSEQNVADAPSHEENLAGTGADAG